MKTFKQFLSEAEVRDVKTLIERDCGPFLRESKGAGFLHRGIKGFGQLDYNVATIYDDNKVTYAIKNARRDRQPLNTDKRAHPIINKWFEKNMGFPARSGAVFTFGEMSRPGRLRQFGDPCIIFPIGEIKYAWSPKVLDLWTSKNTYDTLIAHGASDSELEAEISKWLESKEYRNDGLDEAIRDGDVEIMIECDKYYAFEIGMKEEIQLSLDIFPAPKAKVSHD